VVIVGGKTAAPVMLKTTGNGLGGNVSPWAFVERNARSDTMNEPDAVGVPTIVPLEALSTPLLARSA